jgi:hypothetical protein
VFPQFLGHARQKPPSYLYEKNKMDQFRNKAVTIHPYNSKHYMVIEQEGK